jgi:predicted thioesterase
MELKIPTGVKHSLEMIVGAEESARHFGSGLVDVYATPALIAFLEKTSLESIDPYLPEGFTSVGSEVQLKHLKATALGSNVRSDSYLKKMEGKKVHYRSLLKEIKKKFNIDVKPCEKAQFRARGV